MVAPPFFILLVAAAHSTSYRTENHPLKPPRERVPISPALIVDDDSYLVLCTPSVYNIMA